MSGEVRGGGEVLTVVVDGLDDVETVEVEGSHKVVGERTSVLIRRFD